MPFVPVNVPPGVVKLATPLQSKGRYWDANLIRWRNGKLLPVGGWQRISESPLSSPCRTIFTWTSNAGLKQAALGCEEQLYILESSTLTNITPNNYDPPNDTEVGAYGAWQYGKLLYGEDTDPGYLRPPSTAFVPSFCWTIDNWGEDILAVSSSDGRLLHYGVGDNKAHQIGVNQIITADRVSNVVTITTDSHHGFLTGDTVVIGGTSVTTMNGTQTITGVPNDLSFTYANSGTNASGTGGTATSPSNSIAPSNNRAVVVTPERHAVLFGAGGNPRRVAWCSREDYQNWNYADTTSTAGYLDLDSSSNIIMACSVREGTLIWTEDEAWLMRYIGLPFIYAIERIGFSCGLIAPRAFATTAGRCVWMGREGFWLYDGGVVKPLPCDVASHVFDEINPDAGILYTNGSENSLFNEVWFWYPSSNSTVPNKYVIYNYAENWWSIGEMTRTAASGAGVFQFPMATDDSNELYFHEDGWTAAGASLIGQRFAETATVNIQNGNQMQMVRQALTDSGYGYSSTQIRLFSTFTPDGTEYEYGPFNPRSDGYTDMRATGRDLRFRIASTQDADWSIGEVRFDIVPKGGR